MANEYLLCTAPRTVNHSYFSSTTSQFCYTKLICSVFLGSTWPPKLGFWSTWTPYSTSVLFHCVTALASSTTAANKTGALWWGFQSRHRRSRHLRLPKRCCSIHSNTHRDALTINTQPGEEPARNITLPLRQAALSRSLTNIKDSNSPNSALGEVYCKNFLGHLQQ